MKSGAALERFASGGISVEAEAVCMTDDPHLQKVRGVKTRWIE